MSFFIKQMVNNKIRQLTVDELLYYSKQYQFTLSEEQAQRIIHYLKNNQLDLFLKSNHPKIFQDLALITDQSTASQAQRLLYEIIRSYGLEHLFT